MIAKGNRNKKRIRSKLLIILVGSILSAGLISHECMLRTMWPTGGDESPTYISVDGNIIGAGGVADDSASPENPSTGSDSNTVNTPNTGGGNQLVNGLDPNDPTIVASCRTTQTLPQGAVPCVAYIKKWTRSDDVSVYITFKPDGSVESNAYPGAATWAYNENGRGSFRTYESDGKSFVQTFILQDDKLYPADTTSTPYDLFLYFH